MVYTPEEKKRMDALVKVFEGFIADSNEIDVVYSGKKGYVRLIVEESADSVYFPIKDFDDMMNMFMFDFFFNQMEADYSTEYGYAKTNLKEPYDCLYVILDGLDDDREYALEILDNYLLHIKRKVKKDLWP